MRKVVDSTFYKMKVGFKEYKIYVKDLKMIKKLRKKKCPPLPHF